MIRVLVEGPHHDLVERVPCISGDVVEVLADAGRGAEPLGIEQCRQSVALERWVTGRRVQQRSGQRVLVAAVGRAAAAHLFRCDVQEVVDDVRVPPPYGEHAQDVVETESAEQRAWCPRTRGIGFDPDATGVHRTMGEVATRRGVERIRKGPEQFDRLRGRQWALQVVTQRDRLRVAVHHVGVDPVAADIARPQHVGVPQTRRSLDILAEREQRPRELPALREIEYAQSRPQRLFVRNASGP